MFSALIGVSHLFLCTVCPFIRYFACTRFATVSALNHEVAAGELESYDAFSRLLIAGDFLKVHRFDLWMNEVDKNVNREHDGCYEEADRVGFIEGNE